LFFFVGKHKVGQKVLVGCPSSWLAKKCVF
jgi:hypothetical protein